MYIRYSLRHFPVLHFPVFRYIARGVPIRLSPLMSSVVRGINNVQRLNSSFSCRLVPSLARLHAYLHHVFASRVSIGGVWF